MRSNHSRLDYFDADLLRIEADIAKSLSSRAELCPIREGLRDRLGRLDRVQTSKELHAMLQLTMMAVSLELVDYNLRSAENIERYPYDPYSTKISIALHSPELRELRLYTCHFGPARCSVAHPSLVYELGSDDRFAQEVGHGLCYRAMLLNRTLAFRELYTSQHSEPIPLLGFRPTSAFVAPLSRTTDNLLRETVKYLAMPAPSDAEVAAAGVEIAESVLGSITIESSYLVFGREQVRSILSSTDIGEILAICRNRLKEFRATRASYLSLKASESLFELAQHSYRATTSYESLLYLISEVFDGADATLHFFDMLPTDENWPPDREERGLKLVAGAGPRFEDALIGERSGVGSLVGEVVFKQRSTGHRTRPEIQRALEGEYEEYPYRRLMDGTVLNVVQPVFYFSRVIAAINLEWDERTSPGRKAEEEEQLAYIKKIEPLLEQTAAYFSLVIDHFDDLKNPRLRSESSPEDVHLIQENRRIMSYFVGDALRKIKKENGWGRSPSEDDAQTRGPFDDLIDAVGYLLAGSQEYRILVSLRRRDERLLKVASEHGLSGRGTSEIEIPGSESESRSVLTQCVNSGVPIFGPIVDSLLKPDRTCLSLSQGVADLKTEIRYKPAGDHNSVYEIAIPLIFGERVIGTFDFEQFYLKNDHRSPGARPGSPNPRSPSEIGRFLQWARALSFCSAFANELSDTARAGADSERYSVFRMLCAAIIAGVPIEHDLLQPIFNQRTRLLLPASDTAITRAYGLRASQLGELERAEEDVGEPGAKYARHYELWIRERNIGRVKINHPESDFRHWPMSDDANASHIRGRENVATRLVNAFHAASLQTSGWDQEPDTIRPVLEQVCASFDLLVGEVECLNDFATQSPRTIVASALGVLNQALKEEILRPVALSSTTTLGWRLFASQYPKSGEKTAVSTLVSGTVGKRWTELHTEDMRVCLDALLDRNAQQSLVAIIGAERVKDAMSVVGLSALEDASRQDLERMVHELLTGKDYPVFREIDLDRRSTTARIATLCLPVVACDLRVAPFRSAPFESWFYRHPYSLVGVPVLLANRCVGVIEILRRRESEHNFEFFKPDEVLALKALAKHVASWIEGQLEFHELKPSQLTDQEQYLISKIEQRGQDLPALIRADEHSEESVRESLKRKWRVAELNTRASTFWDEAPLTKKLGESDISLIVFNGLGREAGCVSARGFEEGVDLITRRHDLRPVFYCRDKTDWLMDHLQGRFHLIPSPHGEAVGFLHALSRLAGDCDMLVCRSSDSQNLRHWLNEKRDSGRTVNSHAPELYSRLERTQPSEAGLVKGWLCWHHSVTQ